MLVFHAKPPEPQSPRAPSHAFQWPAEMSDQLSQSWKVQVLIDRTSCTFQSLSVLMVQDIGAGAFISRAGSRCEPYQGEKSRSWREHSADKNDRVSAWRRWAPECSRWRFLGKDSYHTLIHDTYRPTKPVNGTGDGNLMVVWFIVCYTPDNHG